MNLGANKEFMDQMIQKPNYSGFVVIGGGLPRTGTTSLHVALGQLLEGKCYHMKDVMMGGPEEARFWLKAAEGKVAKADWEDFLTKRGYRAGVDFPISLFYKDLMEAFPQAKVVLSVRNPETWPVSVRNSIGQINKLHNEFAFRMFFKLIGKWEQIEAVHKIPSLMLTGMDKNVFDIVDSGDKEAVAFYNKWVADVKAYVPKDRLLVHEAKEGWEPLCKFLGVPIPKHSYPRVNDTANVQGIVKRLRFISRAVVYGIPLTVLGATVCYVFREEIKTVVRENILKN